MQRAGKIFRPAVTRGKLIRPFQSYNKIESDHGWYLGILQNRKRISKPIFLIKRLIIKRKII